MSHRDPVLADFLGKTITAADLQSVNIWRFAFSDGSAVAIEVDAVAPGIYGMVVCDSCAAATVVNSDQASACDDTEPGC